MQKQIKIGKDPLQKLLPSASIVFTEDSTGGMEAMFFGKPLVHVHFTITEPTMPFTEYEAAVPVFDSEELTEAISRIQSFHSLEQKKMVAGQRGFLSDYAGPLDGKATQRILSFIKNFLEVPN